ncbi:hypothetical protein BOTBODRAFT_198372 [Botryobasidium botryosum FD-172 SS1]|uniref:Uncharacterized protein n=1 Tax=Botryobasidium botryosum (strain FD-172 SS1) TaxID=930990 RepID=A0A067NC07_BOTB1|nr:hypothetical protein BOTBODRAFT_198372 [Botryobasidium botryosum FD-172 SS1]
MYTTRVRGEPKECAPCRAKDPQLRIRTWMVNPDVLKANQGWLKTGLVVPSGALWGEEEPPVSKAAGKRAAPAKDAAGGSRSKRVRITPVDDSQLDAFKTVRDKLCGGKDEEDLFKVGADENEEEDEFE